MHVRHNNQNKLLFVLVLALTERNEKERFQALVPIGGAIILVQYLRMAPIVIPTLLALISVLVGSIVVNFF